MPMISLELATEFKFEAQVFVTRSHSCPRLTELSNQFQLTGVIK